ncbi:MAG: PHP-associated domain-containing protein [Bacteroidota bacterium]
MGFADIHIHTHCSDGVSSPQRTVDYVIARQELNLIAITDHDTIEGGLIARDYLYSKASLANRLEIVVGSEISSLEGHIVGLFLEFDVPAKMSAEETVNAIHDQGGIAIAVHPYTFVYRVSKTLAELKGVADRIKNMHFDAVEVINSNPTELMSNWYTTWINRTSLRLPELGSSDGHFLSAIGRAFTEYRGITASDFRKSIFENSVTAHGGVWGIGAFLSYLRERRTVRSEATMLQEVEA